MTEIRRSQFVLFLICIVSSSKANLISSGNEDRERERCKNITGTWSGTEVYRGRCYQFFLDKPQVTWNEAQAICHSKGGSLISVEDFGYQKFIEDVLNGHTSWHKQGFWISLHDTHREGRFVWENADHSEKAAVWTNWYDSFWWHEPNNRLGNQNCVYMRRGYQWKWVDVACDGGTPAWWRKYSYACQYEMPTYNPKPTILTTTSPTTTATTTMPTTTTTKPITTPATTSRTTKSIATLTTTTTTTPATTRKHVEKNKPKIPPPNKADSGVTVV